MQTEDFYPLKSQSVSKTISNVELMIISSQTHQPTGMMIKTNAGDHATVVSKEKPDVSPILTEQMHFPIIILHASLSNLVICQASFFRLRRMECFFVIFEKKLLVARLHGSALFILREVNLIYLTDKKRVSTPPTSESLKS